MVCARCGYILFDISNRTSLGDYEITQLALGRVIAIEAFPLREKLGFVGMGLGICSFGVNTILPVCLANFDFSDILQQPSNTEGRCPNMTIARTVSLWLGHAGVVLRLSKAGTRHGRRLPKRTSLLSCWPKI